MKKLLLTIFVLLAIFALPWLATCATAQTTEKQINDSTQVIHLDAETAQDLDNLNTEMKKLAAEWAAKNEQHQTLFNAVCRTQKVDPKKINRLSDGAIDVVSVKEGEIVIRLKPETKVSMAETAKK